MPVIWTESFETGVGSARKNKQLSTSSTGSNYTATARTGSFGYIATYTVNLLGTDQDDVMTAGGAWRLGPSVNTQLLQFVGDTGSVIHVTIAMQTGVGAGMSVIKAYRGTTAGTLLGTSAEFVDPAVEWVYVEAKVKLSDSVGTIDVHMGNVSVLSLTGLDTKNGGTGVVFDAVNWLGGSGSTTGPVDDIYLTNEQAPGATGFLGSIKVEVIRPNGNGNSSQGVGSDGNSVDNYLLVDEVSGDANYVDFAAVGDKDTYAFSDIATTAPYVGTGTLVLAAAIIASLQKTDAGALTGIHVARLSATEADNTGLPLINGSFARLWSVFETDPGGGLWSLGDINSAEFGVKSGA